MIGKHAVAVDQAGQMSADQALGFAPKQRIVIRTYRTVRDFIQVVNCSSRGIVRLPGKATCSAFKLKPSASGERGEIAPW